MQLHLLVQSIDRSKKIGAVFIISILVVVAISRFGDSDPLIFEVEIPAHTPDKDAIILHIQNREFVMERISDTLYRYSLSVDDFPNDPGNKVGYGYSRGGFMPFAEAGLYENQYIRSVELNPGGSVRDIVNEWKWFPVSPLVEELIPSSANIFQIEQRNSYWKGIQFVDFWADQWPYQYQSSIDHLIANGMNWIAIASPWDYVSEDPVMLSATESAVPGIPEDQLREHIQVFKDAGFKVMLIPFTCCTGVEVEGKDAAWFDQWSEEMYRFYQYHADIAKQENVDAISLSVALRGETLPLSEVNIALNKTKFWSNVLDIFDETPSAIGFESTAFPGTWDPYYPYPSTFVDFYDRLDFFGVGISGQRVNSSVPTQKELNEGFENTFRQLDLLHSLSGLPAVITHLSVPSFSGATSLAPTPEIPYLYGDPDDVPYEYNSTEQAMAYEAFMRGVANRSYVIGSFPFGYWYVDAPLTIDDTSIRGKMAEIIYSNWLNRFPN